MSNQSEHTCPSLTSVIVDVMVYVSGSQEGPRESTKRKPVAVRWTETDAHSPFQHGKLHLWALLTTETFSSVRAFGFSILSPNDT